MERVEFQRIPQRYLEKVKKENPEIIQKTNSENLSQIEKEWREVEDKFFKKLHEFTGIKPRKDWKVWLTNEIIGHYHPERRDTIIVHVGREEIMQIAEEIFHQHYWDIWGNRDKQPWLQEDKWKISETVVGFFLEEFGLDVRKTRERCYPFISEVRKEIKPLLQKNNFREFINQVKKGLENGTLEIC